MTQPSTAREAAERNAKAIMEGNLSQLMADITGGKLKVGDHLATELELCKQFHISRFTAREAVRMAVWKRENLRSLSPGQRKIARL